MQRIVHLDLKGAPWKIPYLEKVIIAAKHWGATGIVFEWEDTFPYSGFVTDIGSVRGSSGDGLYSADQVKHIMQFVKDIGLEAIQLIQTIGHMEFVLKHPVFIHLRESPRSPAVLCPLKADSRRLVKTMLEQAMDAQPDARYIHIGADEVWHSGVCPQCQLTAAASEHKTASLYLKHIREIAIFIKVKRPELTILMWDDMLRSISLDVLKEYNLGDLVVPVLWHYNPLECFQIDPNLWASYKQLFPRVWAGSAFKGANGSCQIMSPVSRYVSNHQAWIREFKNYGSDINFAGIILTGWSRYDHYATLCELLPVSLPSLASCLRLLAKEDGDCNEPIISDSLPPEEWPGVELARTIHSFVVVRERCMAFIHGDLITTWLNPWQLENNYTNPVQIEGVRMTAEHLLKELNPLRNAISTHLHNITGKRSAEEWIHSFLTPISRRLMELVNIGSDRVVAEAGVSPDNTL